MNIWYKHKATNKLIDLNKIKLSSLSTYCFDGEKEYSPARIPFNPDFDIAYVDLIDEELYNILAQDQQEVMREHGCGCNLLDLDNAGFQFGSKLKFISGQRNVYSWGGWLYRCIDTNEILTDYSIYNNVSLTYTSTIQVSSHELYCVGDIPFSEEFEFIPAIFSQNEVDYAVECIKQTSLFNLGKKYEYINLFKKLKRRNWLNCDKTDLEFI